MKKLICAAIGIAILGVGSLAHADIQSPPGDRYTPVRKLSRALANIFYGPLELPSSVERTLYQEDSRSAAYSYGIINGLNRSVTRIGYGVVELVTFPSPSYKKSYRQPYPDLTLDSVHGYMEFPPAVGFTASDYVRRQSL